MLKRSQSVSLQLPEGFDLTPFEVSPVPTPAASENFLPVSFPDYQRVTISGDYCAGVCITNSCQMYACFLSGWMAQMAGCRTGTFASHGMQLAK